MNTLESQYHVIPSCDVEPKDFTSEDAAKDARADHAQLCDDCSMGSIEIREIDNRDDSESQEGAENQSQDKTNGTQPKEPEVVEKQRSEEIEQMHKETLAESQPLESVPMPDPLRTVPDWMQTEIQHGTETSVDLNKRGTQVIANALDLEVNAECEVAAEDNDFTYARYRATVMRPDGKSYNAVGDAHIDESGKGPEDLERLAETRAKKRAVKWSCGGGIQPFLGEDND